VVFYFSFLILGLNKGMDELLPDRLLKEYTRVFEEFDDLTLARWMAQTLAQLKGRAWRHSHPLLASYRLAAGLGHQRQIWHKRLVTFPGDFLQAPCCRAPMLPLLTRDVMKTGLTCLHCSETLAPAEEIPGDLQNAVRDWATEYERVHAVAHWDDVEQKAVPNYDQAYEDAGLRAEELLAFVGKELMPRFLEHYAAIVWEDHDECLEVNPEDIVL
jgi:hypothetical protein